MKDRVGDKHANQKNTVRRFQKNLHAREKKKGSRESTGSGLTSVRPVPSGLIK